VSTARAEEIAAELARIEAMGDGEAKRSQLANLAIGLWEDARRVDEGAVEGDEARIRALAGAILDLAAAQP
jgi:hypothetical protein